jgi:hypothetical protein
MYLLSADAFRIGADLQLDQDRDVDKEGGLKNQALPRSEEAIVGRRVLDGRLFCQYGR